MKHYYYAEKNQQLGPFTIEELKSKRLKKSTLIWTDGLSDWVAAETLNELDKTLISEPPPIPKKNNIKKVETVKIKLPPTPKASSKYDLTYIKETNVTKFGVFVLLVLNPVTFFLTYMFYNIKNPIKNESDFIQSGVVVWLGIIILIIVLIISIVTVVKVAIRQNRNPIGWGIFAFLLPPFALIIIGLLYKLKLKIIGVLT